MMTGRGATCGTHSSGASLGPAAKTLANGRNDRPWCPVRYGALEAVLEKCIGLPRAVNQPEPSDSLVQHSRNCREERPEAHADELDARGIHVRT